MENSLILCIPIDLPFLGTEKDNVSNVTCEKISCAIKNFQTSLRIK